MQSGAVQPAGSMHNSGCSTEQPSVSVSSALTGVHNTHNATKANALNNTFFIFPPFNGFII